MICERAFLALESLPPELEEHVVSRTGLRIIHHEYEDINPESARLQRCVHSHTADVRIHRFELVTLRKSNQRNMFTKGSPLTASGPEPTERSRVHGVSHDLVSLDKTTV
uniref:Uncharacterized protein n=1 Tax=Knipowitschia caucasica TaxID=637954 RepID=A0AAV2MH74_KNICA